ncbi:protein FAM228A isoform X2 [Conger conger]|uniref:protein FAM228A isoform X2 n=1 Tax=Conger conger TaxID=82655 RepID=UPI002A5A827E|nr:protein FAM228A isoform X2 [Conger conger]
MGTKAGTEKGGCEDTPISVSDSKRSCLGNRIPYPTKCVGKLSAPVGWLSHSSMRRLQAILENENQEARLITQRMLDTEKGFVKKCYPLLQNMPWDLVTGSGQLSEPQGDFGAEEERTPACALDRTCLDAHPEEHQGPSITPSGQ